MDVAGTGHGYFIKGLRRPACLACASYCAFTLRCARRRNGGASPPVSHMAFSDNSFPMLVDDIFVTPVGMPRASPYLCESDAEPSAPSVPAGSSCRPAPKVADDDESAAFARGGGPAASSTGPPTDTFGAASTVLSSALFNSADLARLIQQLVGQMTQSRSGLAGRRGGLASGYGRARPAVAGHAGNIVCHRDRARRFRRSRARCDRRGVWSDLAPRRVAFGHRVTVVPTS